jgi:GT2 family glycosyltransferase
MHKTAAVLFSWKDSEKTQQKKEDLVSYLKDGFINHLYLVYTDVDENSVNEYENITEIRFSDHPGFGLTSKKVYDLAKSRFIDFLIRIDNDFHLDNPQMINSCCKYLLQNPTVGIVTGRLRLKDNSLNYASVRYNYFGGKAEKNESETPIKTDSFLGAFFVVSMASLSNFDRFFDPNIILFGEELELALCLKSNNLESVYLPSISGVHECSGTMIENKNIYTKLKYLNHVYILTKYKNKLNLVIYLIRTLIRFILKFDLFYIKIWLRMLRKKYVTKLEWNESLKNL